MKNMKIIDLSPELEKLYFCCLEDWSKDMAETGNHKECWYRTMKEKGARVKLAQADNGEIGGMIQYIPIEYSQFEGNNCYVVLCIWIHGHKQGRGNFQKKGMGKALLKAAEDDVKSLGSAGLATWGLILPFFMRASWFKKHGYKTVDKDGMARLLWKPFVENAVPPKFIKLKKKPELVPGKVAITTFINGWCPGQNMAIERTKRAMTEFGDKIAYTEYNTLDNRNIIKEWGLADAIFVDRKMIVTGPPPSYEKVRKIIEKKVNKLKS
jgi:GNAT superfamily N-acetyltransferase